jgi:hypothetical protein
MYFEFDKVRSQNWIVEGDYDNQFYYHFNFSAIQACSKTCLFFAEVIPDDGDNFDITCCKLLNDDDNGIFTILSNYAANCYMCMLWNVLLFKVLILALQYVRLRLKSIFLCVMHHLCTGLLHN